MPRLIIYRPGPSAFADYDGCVAFQEARVAELRAREDADLGYLLLVRHRPIFTLGRSASASNIRVSRERLAAEGIDLRDCSRGGDVTYHGPGQIVGYPLISLRHGRRDVHAYLRDLEQVLIDALGDFGVIAGRRRGFTGVWVGEEKIAAIGVAIRGWVTYHGFALNVDPNLAHFGLIHPCGIVGVAITSMEELLGRSPGRAEVEGRLIAHFCAEFGFEKTNVGDGALVSEEET